MTNMIHYPSKLFSELWVLIFTVVLKVVQKSTSVKVLLLMVEATWSRVEVRDVKSNQVKAKKVPVI